MGGGRSFRFISALVRVLFSVKPKLSFYWIQLCSNKQVVDGGRMWQKIDILFNCRDRCAQGIILVAVPTNYMEDLSKGTVSF